MSLTKLDIELKKIKSHIYRVLFRGKDIQTKENSKEVDLKSTFNLKSKSIQALLGRLGFVAEVEEIEKVKLVDYQNEFIQQMNYNSNFHKDFFEEKHYLNDKVEALYYMTTIDSSDEEPELEKEDSNIAKAKTGSMEEEKKKKPKEKIGDGEESETEENDDYSSVASETASERKERKRKEQQKKIDELPPEKPLEVPQPKLKKLKLSVGQKKMKEEFLALGYDEWELDEMFEKDMTRMQSLNRTLFVS